MNESTNSECGRTAHQAAMLVRSISTNCFLACIVTAKLTQPASAIVVLHINSDSQAVSRAASFDAVGLLDSTMLGEGSAILVAPDKLITAAHNFDDDGTVGFDAPANTFSFYIGDDLDWNGNTAASADQIIGVASAVLHPNYVSGNASKSQFDIAVVTLATPVIGITPMAVSSQDPNGMNATLIGYGGFGNGAPPFQDNDPDGKRRAVDNVIDFLGNDATDGFVIKTDFDSPARNTSSFGSNTPLVFEGTSAGGDSGGAIVTTIGSSTFLVGVMSGSDDNSFNGDSEYGDILIGAPIMDASTVNFLRSEGVTLVPEPSAAALSLMALLMFAGHSWIRARSSAVHFKPLP